MKHLLGMQHPSNAAPHPETLGLLGEVQVLTAQFAQIKDIDSLVRVVYETVLQTVPVDYHGLYLFDPKTGAFRLPLAHGFTEAERQEAERTAMDRHPGWVVQNKAALYIPDVSLDPLHRTTSSDRSFVVRSRLWLPVMSQETCVGAFGLASGSVDAFGPQHISILTFAADLAGIIYGNLVATETLRAALDRAEAADRAKTAFLANMSHELRTPMNGIVGAAGLLATNVLSPEQVELVQTIEGAARSMVALVDDLLEVSKIESGFVDVRLDRVELEPWLDSTLDIVAPQIVERCTEFFVRYLPNAPTVGRFDPTRARQILLNLLSNALKFTDRGSVTLSLGAAADGAVELTVEDTGVGIAPDATERLFERFSQVDDSVSRRFGGTGLGLAISRQLAQAMDGEVCLVRSTPGLGSCFCLRLPAEAPEPGELSEIERGPVALQFVDARRRDELTAALAHLGWRSVLSPREAEPTTPLITDLPIPGRAGATITWGPAGSNGDLRPPLRLGSLRRALTPPAPAPPPNEPPSSSRVLTILVVDDHSPNRLIARRILERAGHAVVEAAGGKAALQACRASLFDLILLDVHMPEEDGLSVVRRLRAGDAGPNAIGVPVYALTADLSPKTASDCRAAGMYDVLQKPIVVERLLSVTDEASTIGSRVLIVDDSTVNRLLLRRMLERRGLHVEEASTGPEMVAALERRPFRFVLLDEHLDGMSGSDLARFWRDRALAWRHLPIIATTGALEVHPSPGTYNDVLFKPIDLAAIDKVLARWGPPA
jgi:signal transduction histidine kinase/CheY-like chemotaxis protein